MRVFLALLFAASLTCGKSLTVEWSRTPEALAGKIVRVNLKDGSVLDGDWIGVTPNSFTMRVNSTTSDMVRKGTNTLARSSIGALAFRRHRIRGRVIGTALGWFISGGIVSAISRAPDASPIASVALAGAAAGGLLIGRSVDREMTAVVILDSP